MTLVWLIMQSRRLNALLVGPDHRRVMLVAAVWADAVDVLLDDTPILSNVSVEVNPGEVGCWRWCTNSASPPCWRCTT